MSRTLSVLRTAFITRWTDFRPRKSFGSPSFSLMGDSPSLSFFLLSSPSPFTTVLNQDTIPFPHLLQSPLHPLYMLIQPSSPIIIIIDNITIISQPHYQISLKPIHLLREISFVSGIEILETLSSSPCSFSRFMMDCRIMTMITQASKPQLGEGGWESS